MSYEVKPVQRCYGFLFLRSEEWEVNGKQCQEGNVFSCSFSHLQVAKSLKKKKESFVLWGDGAKFEK